MEQKSAFALGAIKREVDFDTYHFAENLLTMSYLNIFNKIQRSNVTLDYEIENQYIQAAQQTVATTSGEVALAPSDIAQISLQMRVPPS